MSKPQHRTAEHRVAYQAIRQAQALGEWLVCHQPVCVMPSRDIAPDQAADVCHNDSGTVILGPGHARCNRVEAGQKRHRVTASDRWIL